MIRMVQSTSAAQAKAYYTDALHKSDYYITDNDQELTGHFRGLLAERIGIAGPVTRAQFFDLCENKNPVTGEQLTPRTSENRTVGYDINFHVPKSVSIVHALSKDDHILDAFRASVHDTMADIEADAQTRVRVGRNYDNRKTGSLLYADFIHQTARPVEGHLPDPHLHAHCYVFNATWDNFEQKIKAGQFRDIVRDSPYYTARFQKRLSDRLIALGYDIRATKNAFEIVGVPQQVINHFSKRTDEIGRAAKALGITGADALDSLGARTRAKKQKDVGMDELKADWRRQIGTLGITEVERNRAVRFGPDSVKELPTLDNSVSFSLDHHFEKASVVPERKLLATAYKQSIGNSAIGFAALDDRLQQDPVLIRVEDNGRMCCTNLSVLSEEQHMVNLARAGRGTMEPLYRDLPPIRAKDQQGNAIAHILSTTDQVSIIRGAAGTGKTTLMGEAVDWIRKAGKDVTVVAPSVDASRGVLRSDGFSEANTVAWLLQNRKAQDKLQDGVLWVDEAGMLGTRDMTALLELAKEKNARLLLGGDTRQHSSTERGDALRILNVIGKIKTAEVSKIYRQQKEDYLRAVQALADGDIKTGFERLDAMGAIVNIDPQKPHDGLVDQYIGCIKKGKQALVISPTNAHRQQVTEAIRDRMRSEGMLGKKEIQAQRLQQQHYSEAEKQNWQSYKPGQVVQFSQHAPGFKRGSRWDVKEVSQKGVLVSDPASGKTALLPQALPSRFHVMERSGIALAKGDKIRVTHPGYDQEKRHMETGQILDVAAVRKDGRITLENRTSKQQYHIDKNFGHIDHAHCMTSYAAQGKTVDQVLIAQSAVTFPATNSQQFYVSASRARQGITIYTDDKAELLNHAQRPGERSAALELTAMQKHTQRVADKQRDTPPPKERHTGKSHNKTNAVNRSRHVEPGH